LTIILNFAILRLLNNKLIKLSMNFRNIFSKGKAAAKGKKFFIIGTVLILLVFILILIGANTTIFSNIFSKNVKKILTIEEAKATAEKFINENLLPAGTKATIKNVTDEGDVYNINLDVAGQDYTSYMSKDGSKFFQSGVNMATFAEEQAARQAAASASDTKANQATEVPKTDKPKVELFVMTECPYGLQAEKGILPALAALGNKIEAKIRFVHYFMHGDKEEQETYNQICIREEQAAKFNAYLNCYVVSGDTAACQTTAGINKAKLSGCAAAKAKDYYKVDSGFSEGYGVSGSPTLVINGVQSRAGRDAASYLAGICAAFTTKPAECSKELSSASPSSGFGAGSDSGGSAASCN